MSSRQLVLPIVLTLLVAALAVGVGFAEVLPIEMFDGGGGEGLADVGASGAPEVTAEVAVEAEVEAGQTDRFDVAATAGEDDRLMLAAEDHEAIGKAEEGNLLALLSIELSGEISGEAGTEASADRAREPEIADSGATERAVVEDRTE